MATLTHELGSVSTWVGWTAGVAAAAAAVGTYARQWPASYRRIASWILLVSGLCLAASSAGWLVVSHLAPLGGHGLGLLALSGAGLGVTIIAVLRIARTTADPVVTALRAIATAAERHVNRLDEIDGADHSRFVDLQVQSSATGGRRKPFNKTLWRRSEQVTIMSGDSGSGKTTMLRELTRRACQGAYAKKRPKRIALYLDLIDFYRKSPEITADTIRSCIQETITAGDSALNDTFSDFLREPTDRLSWMIIFDSIDSLYSVSDPDQQPTIADNYLGAIRQFLTSAGPNFRAIVVTREPSRITDVGVRTLTIPPLSSSQRRNLIRRAGSDFATYRLLLRRLRDDRSLQEVDNNPLLLSLVCEHLRSKPRESLPIGLYELVQVSLATRFSSLQQSIATNDLMLAAEHIAYFISSNSKPGSQPDSQRLLDIINADPKIVASAEEVVPTLIRARICRFELPDVLTFTHRRFQQHFKTAWLLRFWREVKTSDLVTLDQWSEPARVALRHGEDDLRLSIIEEAGLLLRRELDQTHGILSSASLASMLRISPDQALPAPTEFFTWPLTSLHILQLMAEGLDGDPLPVEITETIDRFIISAFAAGMLLDRKRAIDVASIASPEASQWVADRAVVSGKELLQRATARLLAIRSDIFARLRLQTRTVAAIVALIDPRIVDTVLSDPSLTRSDVPTLASSVKSFIRIGQIAAIGLMLFSAHGLVNEATNIHDLKHISGSALDLGWWAFLLLSPTPFLSTWADRRRFSYAIVKLSGLVILVISTLGALEGVFAIVGAIILLATLQFSSAFNDIVFGYFCTWPGSMVAFVVLGPLPTTWDWLVPQIPIARIAWAAIPFPTRHSKARENPDQDVLWKVVKEMRGFAVFAVAVGLLIAAAAAPLPAVRHKDVENVRAAIFVGLLLVYAAMSYIKKHWWTTRSIGRRIIESSQGFSLLEALDDASTREATERLLKKLRNAPPSALRNSTSILEDFARALDYVTRMVPREVKTPIPTAVWDLGPVFRNSEFRNWLVKFDNRYPGRLSWLAEKHQGLAAEILDRSETPVEIHKA